MFYSKALDMHIAVALLRIQEGLDCSAVIGDVEDPKNLAPTSIPGNQSFSQLSQGFWKNISFIFLFYLE